MKTKRKNLTNIHQNLIIENAQIGYIGPIITQMKHRVHVCLINEQKATVQRKISVAIV